jgi:hypothetical protein
MFVDAQTEGNANYYEVLEAHSVNPARTRARTELKQQGGSGSAILRLGGGWEQWTQRVSSASPSEKAQHLSARASCLRS